MFAKTSTLLGFVAVALQATSVSGQACINFAFAPAGTCNSDPNSADRLRADLVQDRLVPGCANGGLYTVVAKYNDLQDSTRWVSAIDVATVAEDFTGTIPFSFKLAQSTISAGPVTLSLIGTNKGGAFTSRVTYTHNHTPTVTYTTATSTLTAWVSSTVTSTSYRDVNSYTTVNPPGGTSTVTRTGVSTSFLTKPTVTVTSYMAVDDRTITEVTTLRQTISSACVSPRLMERPSGAAATPTGQKLRRKDLEKLHRRAQPTTYAVPYCGSTFSTTILPISTVYLQSRSTMVDTVTRVANNVNWITVTANNPTTWVDVTSIVYRTVSSDARTVTSIFTQPRITATETFTDTFTTTVYPPGTPVCNAEVVTPTLRVESSLSGTNPGFSLPAATAGASNFYSGNQMTLPPPGQVSPGFPTLVISGSTVVPNTAPSASPAASGASASGAASSSSAVGGVSSSSSVSSSSGGGSGSSSSSDVAASPSSFSATTLTTATTATTPTTATTATTAPSAASSQAAISCPDSNGQTYTASDGATYMIECSQDRWGGDINYFYRKTMELCVELCEQTTNCRQVSFVIPPSTGADGTCYLKSSSGAATTNTNIWGGRKLTDATSSSTTSSAAAASSSASSGSGGWNGYPASSGAVACPGSNATVYTVPASGSQFLVLCGFDNNGNDMADNPRWAQTSAVPEEMASRCDTTTGCKWATVGGNAAYFKNSVGQTYANANVMGLQKVTGSGVTTKRMLKKKRGELPRMRIVKKGVQNGLER